MKLDALVLRCTESVMGDEESMPVTDVQFQKAHGGVVVFGYAQLTIGDKCHDALNS